MASRALCNVWNKVTLSPKLSFARLKHGSARERLTPATKPLSHSGVALAPGGSDSSSIQPSSDTGPVPSQARRAYSTARKQHRINSAKTLAITSQSLLNSHFSNVSLTFGVLRGVQDFLKSPSRNILHRCATRYYFSGDPPALVFHQRAACPGQRQEHLRPASAPFGLIHASLHCQMI